MTDAKITGMLIGLVLVGLFASGIIQIMGGIKQYAGITDSEYENNTLDNYNRLDEMHIEAKQIQQNVSEIKVDSSFLDVLGGYLLNGYKSLKLTLNSFSILSDMTEDVVGDSGIGTNSDLINNNFMSDLKSSLITISIIIVFIGIFVAILVKRDRL